MSVSREEYTGIEQVLDQDGVVLDDSSVPDIDDETLLEIYDHMKLARLFDKRAFSLARQGRIIEMAYATISGHEAAQVASTHALADEDWIFPSYRQSGAAIARGLDIVDIFQFWLGNEPAWNEALGEENVFRQANVVGSQVPQAMGMAWAAKLRDEERAVLCHFGDGATSTGDFHAGMNFAGVFDTPNVFYCNNNQWALSVPRTKQTASETLAGKANAYGFDGVQVDGMDPLAVYDVVSEAVETAKETESEEPRPTMIESIVYQLNPPNTHVDMRPEKEIEEWQRWDPIPRFETFLLETGRLDEETIDAHETRHAERLQEAIDIAEELEMPGPENLFEYVYAEMPAHLEDQLAELRRIHEEYPAEELTL